MNDALKIQISAFVDGELPENESELLLRRLSQDAALRQQVAEYLAIGRMIRRDPQICGMNELRGRIAAALGEELQQQPAAEEVAGSRYTRPLAGFAIAASVAVLALFWLRQIDVPEVDGQAYTEPPPVEYSPGDSVDDRLLVEMRRYHADSSDAGSVDNLARFVTLELSEEGLVQIAPISHAIAENTESDEDAADEEDQEDQDLSGTRQAE